MDFMTIKQASEKWGICTRRVQTLCTEGRIDGAERLGHQWVIPINAEKPKDARIKCSLTYRTFANFLAGQCLEAVILGMMFVITLSILKMPYALLIGILIAFTALVPIFGAFIGCAVGSFLIFMVNPKQAVLFIIVFLLLQQIEGNLIYPHVVGGSVGLPSIWVLAAVTIGGNLMGIIGMLIFIPLVSVFYTIFREFVYLRLKKQHIKRVTRTDVEEYAEEEIASSFIVPNEK